MTLSVTRRQYNDNEVASTSTFHWVKNDEGVFNWLEVGDYTEHYDNLGQEVIVAYHGTRWDLELVKTTYPDQIAISLIAIDPNNRNQCFVDEDCYDEITDVIVKDLQSNDQYYFDKDCYDKFDVSDGIDVTLDHTTTTRVFWMKCHEILKKLLEAREKDEFLKNLSVCHQIYEDKEFPGFGFHLENPLASLQQLPVEEEIQVLSISDELPVEEEIQALSISDELPVEEEIQALSISDELPVEEDYDGKIFTLTPDGLIIDENNQPLKGEWLHGPLLGRVGIDSEGVTPPGNGSANNPTVDASSDDSQSEYGIPVWIATPSEDEIKEFVDDEIDNQEDKPVAVGSEDNT